MAQRKTCLERLRELEKELGWEGEEKIDYSHLPVIHVQRTKKEKKKIKKHKRKQIKKQYYTLLATFDELTFNYIVDTFDDKAEAIKYMESLSERCKSECQIEYYDSVEDAAAEIIDKIIPNNDPIIQSGYWEQWEEYTKTMKTNNAHKIWKKRQKFLNHITKERKHIQKKYKSFSLYDPLFRARKIDEVELKKKLKQITRENMERRDKFIEQAENLFGLRDPHLIKQFKDRTKAASKALNKYVIDMNRSLIPDVSRVPVDDYFNG